MLYIVEVQRPGFDGSKITIVTSYEDLFDLVVILNQSEAVKAFRVYQNSIQVDAKHFGWGEFKKWVNQFTYENLLD